MTRWIFVSQMTVGMVTMALIFLVVGFQVKAEYFQLEPEKVFIQVPAPPSPAPEPEVIVKWKISEPVERIVKIPPADRDFATYVEFREVMAKYHEGVLLVGGTCIEQSRLIVKVGREDGWDISTEMVNNDTHMVVKGFLLDAGNGRSGIGLFDQETGKVWLKHQVQITAGNGGSYPTAVTTPPDDGKKPKKPKK